VPRRFIFGSFRSAHVARRRVREGPRRVGTGAAHDYSMRSIGLDGSVRARDALTMLILPATIGPAACAGLVVLRFVQRCTTRVGGVT
jgi:hypothetical protein